VTVEIVALENLVEVDLLLADILVAAAAVQGPTALTQHHQAEMAEMEFSPTSPALPHFMEAAGVVAAMAIMRGKAGRVEAATGMTATSFIPRHQVQQTQAVVEEEAK
jgi:hypothetical protein